MWTGPPTPLFAGGVLWLSDLCHSVQRHCSSSAQCYQLLHTHPPPPPPPPHTRQSSPPCQTRILTPYFFPTVLRGLPACAYNHACLISTAGDIWEEFVVMLQVMAQGLLLQLWGPLQFLGWFYREVRQSLVDMEAFFSILQTVPKLPDGKQTLEAPSISGKGLHPAAPEWHEGERGEGQLSAPVGAVGTSGRGVQLELKVSQEPTFPS